jgi:hypothetical protein
MASLLVFVSGEILKWQFPVNAAAEKFGGMVRSAAVYLQGRFGVRARLN